MPYAEKTDVSSDRSRAEIEKTLSRYGASKFMYGWDEGAAVVMFVMEERHVRFHLPMPDRQDREFTHTPGRDLERSKAQAEKAYEQAVRQKWRALFLVIKAKLEAVESGITEFEDEFLSHIVLPDNSTVGDAMKPRIAEAYDTGKVPALPLLGKGK